MESNVEHALQTIGVLFEPGDVIEMRALGVRLTKGFGSSIHAGYFNAENRKAITQAIRTLDGHAEGIYVVLNRLNPVLLARANNRLKPRPKNTTTDRDILERRWLYIDADAVRPAGISATDAEHEAAIERVVRIREYLRDREWPEPIFADSGNGGHLLYRLPPLPLDRAGELVRACLQTLASRFSDSVVKIDESTTNAGRLCKLYGTLTRKGDPTRDRPHRRAKILEVPERRLPVSEEALECLAIDLQEQPRAYHGLAVTTASKSRFDIDTWLEESGLEVLKGPEPYKLGRRWTLRQCVFNPEHERPAVLELASGALVYKCLHRSCADNDWTGFRQHVEKTLKAITSHAERTSNAKLPTPQVTPSFTETCYPEPIGRDAYHGIAGRFVELVEPHTEADPSWLVLLFLTYAGNILGRRAYVRRGGHHYPNLFSCAVGSTSGGRKGTAFSPIELFFKGIDDEWLKSIKSGLSSGEGLIWCVRDPIYKREKGRKGEYEETLVDPGVSDKRLLVRQTEFFGALQVMRRQGNTLSSIIRDAWDRGYLNSMVKNSPACATDAHISIAANIPPEELKRGLLAEDMDNGFANRFLWCCSRRSKLLPEGGKDLNADFEPLRRDFNRINTDLLAGEVTLTGDAQDIWGYNHKPEIGVYRQLAADRPGIFGHVTARAAPQVLRLSLIYALLDGVREIRREHLEAGLEVWRYCEDSCRYLFGDLIGDPVADTILKVLRTRPQGLTRWEINQLFQGNKRAAEIDRALGVLGKLGRANFKKEDTGGKRPAERWFSVRN
jgi:hypothetical protein